MSDVEGSIEINSINSPGTAIYVDSDIISGDEAIWVNSV